MIAQWRLFNIPLIEGARSRSLSGGRASVEGGVLYRMARRRITTRRERRDFSLDELLTDTEPGAAQERGEKAGNPNSSKTEELPGVSDLDGLTQKDIHEARIIRDGEVASVIPVTSLSWILRCPNFAFGNLSAPNRLATMCEKCVPLDRAIEDYRHQQKVIDDRLALTLIAMAIDQLESEKAALHPEKE
jgi:hypothetical protein